jgi:hypothetical protein
MGDFRKTVSGLSFCLALIIGGCASKEAVYESPVIVGQPTPPVLTNVPADKPIPYPQDEPIVQSSLPNKNPNSLPTVAPNYLTQSTPDNSAPVTPSYGSSYKGNCACPDDLDSAGHRCGARSAYSRSGGYNAVCTPTQSFAYLPKTPSYGGTTYVRGYYRKNGTYVRPYTRRRR